MSHTFNESPLSNEFFPGVRLYPAFCNLEIHVPFTHNGKSLGQSDVSEHARTLVGLHVPKVFDEKS